MAEETRTAKILPLTRAHLPTGEADGGVVTLLQRLLKSAEKGDISGVAVAWVEGHNNDICYQIEHGFAWDALLVAAISGCQYEAQRRWRRL